MKRTSITSAVLGMAVAIALPALARAEVTEDQLSALAADLPD
ncbi:hypothetical protein [Thalassococcus profundi]|nr:hypothetical protein [Thalassococcus profundi]